MNRRRSIRKWFYLRWLRPVFLGALLLVAGFTLYLDFRVRDAFEGRRWAMPARVYARPLELYPGLKLAPEKLATELVLLGYRDVEQVVEPGTFRRVGRDFELVTRPFVFGDGRQQPMHLRLSLTDDQVSAVEDRKIGAPLSLARLDPLLIGGIYPGHNEDRVLVRMNEVPQDLIDALIAIEDHKFFSHYGIDPRGIARAVVTLVSGGGVQGGSTLTQQLVKNFFLTPERTLTRKFTEVLMSLLLELHYSKEEILETYINEIYLGQDGNRAIHGFGLASQFYFDRRLAELDVSQAALLVGLVKGPSYYEPRRHAARALERRNLVLAEMRRQGSLGQEQYVSAKGAALGVVVKAPVGTSPYPAFLNLVHRQLERDYRDQDLRSEGLQVLTTLDPHVQRAAERAVTRRLPALEKARQLPDKILETAVVVTSVQNGEVQALVGGRDPRFEGFNRALDARRPVGSIIKPAIYLTALAQPERYTLITPLDDNALVWKERGIPDWEPRNYDKEFHGDVPLRLALAHSYNVASARLGLALGVPRVLANVRRLGVEQELAPYASSLLGAGELTPIEIEQMYQTLASGGFRVPLRAIREVLTNDGQPLQRYPLAIAQAVDPAPAYLVTTALQGVVREGTARGLNQFLPADLGVAGKTGTTDDLRDSWFAGYTGDRVAVVWVGRDDNGPTGLTGAAGAMTIWGDMMTQLDPEPLVPAQPDNVEWVWIDPATLKRADEGCAGAVSLPFILESAPADSAPCAARSPVKRIKNWFQRLFD